MAGVNVPTNQVIREDLTGYIAGFNPELSGFVAHKVLPAKLVNEQDGVIYRIPAEAWLTTVDTERAAYGSTSGSTYTKVPETWKLVEYAHKEAWDTTDSRGYDSKQQADEIRAVRASGTILRDYERKLAARLFNETTFPLSGTTGFTASALWTSFGTSTPVADIQRAKQFIREKTGMEAHMVVIPTVNVEAAANSANVLSRVSGYDPGTRSGTLNPALWSELFGIPVDGIIVPNAFNNTANQNLALSTAPLWSANYVGVGVRNTSQDLELPQLGRSMMLSSEYQVTGVEASSTVTVEDAQIVIDEYSTADNKTNSTRATMTRAAKFFSTDCWVLIRVR